MQSIKRLLLTYKKKINKTNYTLIWALVFIWHKKTWVMHLLFQQNHSIAYQWSEWEWNYGILLNKKKEEKMCQLLDIIRNYFIADHWEAFTLEFRWKKGTKHSNLSLDSSGNMAENKKRQLDKINEIARMGGAIAYDDTLTCVSFRKRSS